MWKFWMLIVLCLVACGQTSGSKKDAKPSDGEKPSSEALEAAVLKALKKTGMDSFASGCGVNGGPPTKLDTVELVEWGDANAREGYLPAKINVAGTCSAEWPRCGEHKMQLCPPQPEKFKTTKPITFRLKKGDFDEWTAEPVQPRNDDPGANEAANAGALDDLKAKKAAEDKAAQDLFDEMYEGSARPAGSGGDEKERLKKQLEDAKSGACRCKASDPLCDCAP